MLRLTPYSGCANSVLHDIILAKDEARRNRLLAAEPQLLERYAEYLNEQPNLEALRASTIDSPLREDCIHCYDSDTHPLRTLKESILSQQTGYAGGQCQYCGLSEAQTFDHYLPKSGTDGFPEFACFARNLVPCCFMCNITKGTKWRCSEGRLFCHLYADPPIADTFLYCEITVEPGGTWARASYRIERPTSLSQRDFLLIENHFRELDLLNRYSRAAARELAEVRDGVVSATRLGEASARSLLSGALESLRRNRGVNHWRTALHRGALEVIGLEQSWTTTLNAVPGFTPPDPTPP